jgi:hypothetical protein
MRTIASHRSKFNRTPWLGLFGGSSGFAGLPEPGCHRIASRRSLRALTAIAKHYKPTRISLDTELVDCPGDLNLGVAIEVSLDPFA